MKGNKKKLLVSVFFAVILITSTVALVLPNILPKDNQESMDATITGTPMDNFPDAQRAQFCGTGEAKSTSYVQEYKIPTVCTQPLAMKVDPSGLVWFGEVNTGKLGSFDPRTETFKEYDNPLWPKGARSMIWGMDYSPDGTLWYTDERFDSLWKYSIADQKYQRVTFPVNGDSLPQRIQVAGSQIIINDFTGNKITFLDPTRTESEMGYLNLPSPYEKSVTSGFAVDSSKHLWYTNWIFQQGGVLIKLDYEKYISDIASANNSTLQFTDYIELAQLPQDLYTPNGLSVDDNGNVWLADTTNSSVFKFEPSTQTFTKYMTSLPPQSTYGNSTGLVKTPITRPYWIERADNGNLIFNEQTANRISLLDPKTESLVEYMIPSKNPFWGDCTGMSDCGIAQVFGFTASGDKVWFSEWVENNIGYVDTSKEIPFTLSFAESEVLLKAGDSISTEFSVSSDNYRGLATIVTSSPDNLINVASTHDQTVSIDSSRPIQIPVTISTGKTMLPGVYKILVGVGNDEITASKYLTINVQP